MKKFLIILVVGAIGVYGLIAVLRGPAREFTEALLSDATQEFGALRRERGDLWDERHEIRHR